MGKSGWRAMISILVAEMNELNNELSKYMFYLMGRALTQLWPT